MLLDHCGNWTRHLPCTYAAPPFSEEDVSRRIESHVAIYPITETTAEIIARVGGEQAAKGINLPVGDLIIGACALELGYAVGTGNIRDFSRIPGLDIVHL